MQQAIVDFDDGGSRAQAKEFNGLNARNGLEVTARKKEKEKKVGIFVLQFKGTEFCQQYKWLGNELSSKSSRKENRWTYLLILVWQGSLNFWPNRIVK